MLDMNHVGYICEICNSSHHLLILFNLTTSFTPLWSSAPVAYFQSGARFRCLVMARPVLALPCCPLHVRSDLVVFLPSAGRRLHVNTVFLLHLFHPFKCTSDSTHRDSIRVSLRVCFSLLSLLKMVFHVSHCRLTSFGAIGCYFIVFLIKRNI